MLNAPNGIPLKLLNKAEYVLLPRSTLEIDFPKEILPCHGFCIAPKFSTAPERPVALCAR
jgi:hypothetical protein